MPVDARTQFRFGVVEVDTLQILEADNLGKFAECSVARFHGAQIVSGGESVAGIQADAYSLLSSTCR